MSQPPDIDYTLAVHKRDELNGYFITCPEQPGFLLYGPRLIDLLMDAPYAMQKLRDFNSASSSTEVRS